MNLSKFLESHLDFEYIGQDKTLIICKSAIDMSHISTQSYVEVRILDYRKNKETYLVKLQFLTHNEFYPENSCAWLDRVECATWYVVE